ncbi:hypothetical protein [Bizionia sp. M204]|uniref:hypothetical protein n=1 Tax=Bizionia sp. M204 TaxID=2675331 RepID=UPI002061D6A3|nr:hypothetical protein [Bizionia sp. M204]UPS92826.1 hypothetical protein GMA17_14325 [Bizionia sp. M204]
MKFIPPLEIASKIMTLIEESNKELILVSPYVELSKWNKMRKCLDRAVNRGVEITFVARKNAKQDLSFLQLKGINLVLVNDLHAKLYLNEEYGIVTSQNIVYYSDVNSIDIAYKTVSDDQRSELVEFVDKYVVKLEGKSNKSIGIIDESVDFESINMTSQEIRKLGHFFIQTYDKRKFVITFNYIFCGNLIPFADVMISSVYTVKTSKSNNENIDDFIKEILSFNLNLKNDFDVQLWTRHNKFYYIYFVPKVGFKIEDLISDFDLITQAIVNSKYAEEFERRREVNVRGII